MAILIFCQTGIYVGLPATKHENYHGKSLGRWGTQTLTQRDIFRQGSRRAHLPRRECSYGSFRGNPGFGCVKVSHAVSCFHYITTCPTTSPSPLCTHLFAHTFVCTHYIILMILFVYYCCFIDINIYIHIWREIYTHSFQFPGCLATSRLVMLFTGLLPRQQRHHLRTRRSTGSVGSDEVPRVPHGPNNLLTWYCNNSRYNMTGGTTFKKIIYIYIYVHM